MNRNHGEPSSEDNIYCEQAELTDRLMKVEENLQDIEAKTLGYGATRTNGDYENDEYVSRIEQEKIEEAASDITNNSIDLNAMHVES